MKTIDEITNAFALNLKMEISLETMAILDKILERVKQLDRYWVNVFMKMVESLLYWFHGTFVTKVVNC